MRHALRLLGAGLASALVATGLLQANPVSAAAGHRGLPPVVRERAVPVHPAAAGPAFVDHAAALRWQPPAVPAWPSGSATVAVAASGRPARAAGALPVSVGPSAAGAPGRVSIRLLDRATPARAGIAGPMLEVARADGRTGAGPVSLRLDYSAFAPAFGADWGSRLHLVALPACAASTPDRAACRTPAPVASTNDARHQTLSADVSVGSSSVLLAAVSGPSGPAGSYTATSLSPASTWQAGLPTGDFTWSYPMRTPPAEGGLAPGLTLSYDSGNVDGQVGPTNNQGSWIGLGFDYWPGSIERQYNSCKDMGVAAADSGQAPPGDECWSGDNATLSLNGKSVRLVKDATSGAWHPSLDDGSRIEHLTGAANGAQDGEYWRITDVHGVQYYFGLNQLPGWTSGKAVTNSTWTVPVYAKNAGEPCHQSTFSSSFCPHEAWRWNLDYVVDPRGNAMTLWYDPESNSYLRGAQTSSGNKGTLTQYTRGGTLDHISYGLRGDNLFASAPEQVAFGSDERCFATSSFTCTDANFTAANASHWPDVPIDQSCKAGDACTGNVAPTFWSRKRLTSITTSYWNGGGYTSVDSWALRQHFIPNPDGTAPSLWLDGVTHKGLVGGSAALPEVRFDPGANALDNRVADSSAGSPPPLQKWRLQNIYTESGDQITVSYSAPECVRSALPTPQSNGSRCFPQFWIPPGAAVPAGQAEPDPVIDWFHKYRVDQVVVTDSTGASPAQEYHYAYVDTPAWHIDTSPVTPAKFRTWGEWRGYSQVRTTQGRLDGSDGTPLVTTHTFLRGMDGDWAVAGGGQTKSSAVTDSQGVAVRDVDQLQGFLREQVTTLGDGGAEVSGTIDDAFTQGPTATQGLATAWMVRTGAERTRTDLASGGVRTTEKDTTYNSDGLPLQVNDLGDTSTSADDLCTRTTYAPNSTAHLVDVAVRVETVSASCSTAPVYPADAVSDTRTLYDGQAFGAAPTAGLVTGEQKLSGYDGSGNPTYVTVSTKAYDAVGRETSVEDALGHRTTTSYTPASGGPLTQKVVTQPGVGGAAGFVTTTDLNPAWGATVDTVDPNGKRTDMTYDPLGRSAAVWEPGQSRAGGASANLTFAYQVSNSSPTSVATTQLRPGGGHTTSYQLLDGSLRVRQTQAPSAGTGGGSVLTDTFYDSRGKTVKVNASYYASAAPGGTLLVEPDAQVPGQTVTTYDGAGRETASIQMSLGSELWRTTTSYGGDSTTVVPPAGGTATTTFVDGRGRTTDLRQYHDLGMTSGYDDTRYTYTPDGKQATITDPAGTTWTNRWDVRGRKVEADDPDTGVTTTGYDDLDHVVSQTDGRGQTLAYTYDELGRKTGEYSGSPSGTRLAGWTYDSVAKGQPSSATRFAGGSAYTTTYTAYDDANHPTSTTFTIPSAEGALAGSYTFGAAYNPEDGTLASETFPAAGGLAAETVTHTENAAGLPFTLSGQTGYVQDSQYDQTNELLQTDLGTSQAAPWTWQASSYDPATRRLTESKVGREGVTAADSDVSYTYDSSGNVTKIGDAATKDSQCFTNDYLQRLTAAWTPSSGSCGAAPASGALGGPAPYWQSFTYDVTGNRTSSVDHAVSAGGADTTATYSFPAAGQPQAHTLSSVTSSTGGGAAITNTYGYDAAGNTTSRNLGASGDAQTLTWDPEGELAGDADKAGTTTFAYDAAGSQLVQHDPSGATLFLPGEELRYDGGTKSVIATRYYTHGTNVVAARTPGALTWLLNDRQSTNTITVDASTQAVSSRTFKPFGEPRSGGAAWPTDKGFVGGTVDASTGLTQLGHRAYDPTTGRFVSADPVLNTDNPQQMNGYAYAESNPVTTSDPTGLCSPDGGCGCRAGSCNVGGGGGSGSAGGGGCWGWECTSTGSGGGWGGGGGCWGWECTSTGRGGGWVGGCVVQGFFCGLHFVAPPTPLPPPPPPPAPPAHKKHCGFWIVCSLVHDVKTAVGAVASFEGWELKTIANGVTYIWNRYSTYISIGGLLVCAAASAGACFAVGAAIAAGSITARWTNFSHSGKRWTDYVNAIGGTAIDVGTALTPTPRMAGRSWGDTLFNRYVASVGLQTGLTGIEAIYGKGPA